MLMGEISHCTYDCWRRINCYLEYTVAKMSVVAEALGKVTGWTTATSLPLARYSNTVILLANQVAIEDIVPS